MPLMEYFWEFSLVFIDILLLFNITDLYLKNSGFLRACKDNVIAKKEECVLICILVRDAAYVAVVATVTRIHKQAQRRKFNYLTNTQGHRAALLKTK